MRLAIIFLISLSVFADKYFPDGEWETAKPDQVGLDQKKIDRNINSFQYPIVGHPK